MDVKQSSSPKITSSSAPSLTANSSTSLQQQQQPSMDTLLEKLRGEMTELSHQGDAYTQQILTMYATFEGLIVSDTKNNSKQPQTPERKVPSSTDHQTRSSSKVSSVLSRLTGRTSSSSSPVSSPTRKLHCDASSPVKIIHNKEQPLVGVRGSNNKNTIIKQMTPTSSPQVVTPNVKTKQLAVGNSTALSSGEQSDSGTSSVSVTNSLLDTINSITTTSSDQYTESEEDDDHNEREETSPTADLSSKGSRLVGRKKDRRLGLRRNKASPPTSSSSYLSSSDADSIVSGSQYFESETSIDSGYHGRLSSSATSKSSKPLGQRTTSGDSQKQLLCSSSPGYHHPSVVTTGSTSFPSTTPAVIDTAPPSGGLFAAKVANRLKAQQTESHLEHLLHVRQTLINAIHRVEGAQSVASCPQSGVSPSPSTITRGISPISRSSRSTSPALTVISAKTAIGQSLSASSSSQSPAKFLSSHSPSLLSTSPQQSFLSSHLSGNNFLHHHQNANLRTSPTKGPSDSASSPVVVTASPNPTRRLLPTVPPVAIRGKGQQQQLSNHSQTTVVQSTLLSPSKSVRFDRDIRVSSFSSGEGQQQQSQHNSANEEKLVVSVEVHSSDNNLTSGMIGSSVKNFSSLSNGNRSILRDPLLEGMRSQVKAGEFSSSSGLEDEIDALLYGKSKAFDTHATGNTVDYQFVSTFPEVSYVSMIEDRYRVTSGQSSASSSLSNTSSLSSTGHLVGMSSTVLPRSGISKVQQLQKSSTSNSPSSSSSMTGCPSSSITSSVSSVNSSPSLGTTGGNNKQVNYCSSQISNNNSSNFGSRLPGHALPGMSAAGKEGILPSQSTFNTGQHVSGHLSTTTTSVLQQGKEQQHKLPHLSLLTRQETIESTPPSSSSSSSIELDIPSSSQSSSPPDEDPNGGIFLPSVSTSTASGHHLSTSNHLHNVNRKVFTLPNRESSTETSTETSEVSTDSPLRLESTTPSSISGRSTVSGLRTTSPHIHAILEKHLSRRRKSLDAISQNSVMTQPELHIYEEVYDDSTGIMTNLGVPRLTGHSLSTSLGASASSTCIRYHKTERVWTSGEEEDDDDDEDADRILMESSHIVGHTGSRQRGNIYSLMRDQAEVSSSLSSPHHHPRIPVRRSIPHPHHQVMSVVDTDYGFEAAV